MTRMAQTFHADRYTNCKCSTKRDFIPNFQSQGGTREEPGGVGETTHSGVFCARLEAALLQKTPNPTLTAEKEGRGLGIGRRSLGCSLREAGSRTSPEHWREPGRGWTWGGNPVTPPSEGPSCRAPSPVAPQPSAGTRTLCRCSAPGHAGTGR